MKVLVVGGGGREHVLARAISESPRVSKVFCAPGNAGIAAHATLVDLSAEDLNGLERFAASERVDLTVVGPEAPLCDGIVDLFREKGLRIFGPTKAAAALEGSKVFSKTLMQKHMIPTPSFRVFDEAADARTYLRSILDWPVVVKADGLAAGKGVIVAEDLASADEAVEGIMEQRRFGAAGTKLVVEEHLQGDEASILAFTDGQTISILESSQDHKAIHEGDTGPNTGGMGAYCPASVVTEKVLSQVGRDVLVPVVHALGKEGRPYRGILYAGLMITKSGPKVLEFNVRFGDPEAQAVIPRLRTDIVDLMTATIDGGLEDVPLEWDPRPTVCVVMASGGYPGSYEKGKPIKGLGKLADAEDVHVYHAGTSLRDGNLVTSGGRVLGVTAFGADLAAARDRAYEAVDEIEFEGAYFRRDIGHRELDAV